MSHLNQNMILSSLVCFTILLTKYLLTDKIDADKGGYITYFNTIMDHDLLTDRGVIVVDNGNISCIIHDKYKN